MSTIIRTTPDRGRETLWEDGVLRVRPEDEDAIVQTLGRKIGLTPTGPFVYAGLDEPIEAYALLIAALPGEYETIGDGFDLLEPDPDDPEDAVY